MLFKRHTLEGIRQGVITVAFRKWKRPTVKEGGTLQTPAGQLYIRKISPVRIDEINLHELHAAGLSDQEELKALIADRKGELVKVEFDFLGGDPREALRKQRDIPAKEIDRIISRIHKLDQNVISRDWASNILKLIDQYPGKRAADLAEMMGVEKDWLKPQIRKLKAMGLTESLEVGYRLSPRGQVILEVNSRK